MMFDTEAQLGQTLVSRGLLDADNLEVALREHHKTGERLGDVLVKMNMVGVEDVLRCLAEQLQLPFVRLGDVQIPKSVIERVPAKLVSHYHCVPLEQHNGSIRVAVSDPLDVHMLDDLRFNLKLEVEAVVAPPKDIDDAIKR